MRKKILQYRKKNHELQKMVIYCGLFFILFSFHIRYGWVFFREMKRCRKLHFFFSFFEKCTFEDSESELAANSFIKYFSLNYSSPDKLVKYRCKLRRQISNLSTQVCYAKKYLVFNDSGSECQNALDMARFTHNNYDI